MHMEVSQHPDVFLSPHSLLLPYIQERQVCMQYSLLLLLLQDRYLGATTRLPHR